MRRSCPFRPSPAKQERAAVAVAKNKAQQVRLCASSMSVFKHAERRL